MKGTRSAPAERFWSKVRKTPTCWLWTAGVTTTGYGAFTPQRHVQVKAHRWSYEAVNGPIPDGLVLDHLCRNTLCVNPSHLEPVTNEENVLRGFSPHAVNARRSRCAEGHEFEYRTRVDGTLRRWCRECHNEKRRQRRAKARLA